MLHRASAQQAWTAQLQAVLPEPLCRDCRITEVRGPTVVVVCSNAGSATRLRFMTPELLDTLRELSDFSDAREMQIRVSAR